MAGGITRAIKGEGHYESLLANAAGGATINADVGTEMGMASSVTYNTTVGNTGTHRITIAALPTGVTDGDTWCLSVLVKATTATTLGFYVTSGSYARYTACPVDTKWRRVVLSFEASTTDTPLLYVNPGIERRADRLLLQPSIAARGDGRGS